jgi:hypothetical protein
MTTITAARPAPATSRTTRLAMAREAALAAGWTARVVKLDADERAERIADYALEG